MKAAGVAEARVRTVPAVASAREYVRCDLCGADDTELLFEAQDTLRASAETFSIVCCRRCALGYLNPRPTSAALEPYYSADYFDSFTSGALRTSRARIVIRRLHSRLTGRLAHRIEALPPGRVLDVGCGDGRYLELFQVLGWDAYGVDPSRVAIERACQRGLEAFHGDLAGAALEDGCFDLVVMRYVIENMPNPSAVLREAWRVLKDGGILFLAVPKIDFPLARLLKGYCSTVDVPRNLYFFTADSLTRMLESSGFYVEWLTAVPNSLVRDLLDRLTRGRLKSLLRNRWIGRLLWAAEFPFTLLLSQLGLNRGNMEVIARK